MKILGIKIQHPSLGDLMRIAALIIVVTMVACFLNSINLLPTNFVWPMVSAMTVGAVLNAFGVSIVNNGWRALAIVIGACTLLSVLTFGFF